MSKLDRKHVPGARFLPSAMTVAAICLALTSVKLAHDGDVTPALALLAVAAILDALDGRTARALGTESRMGAEIDSLADAVNFGVAPAFIVYWTLFNPPGAPDQPTSPTQLSWVVVMLYAVCIVLRLARYNAALATDKPSYEKDYFVGMPAPAGAVGAIGPLAAKMQFPGEWWSTESAQWVVIVWTIGVSLLVVSAIPMRKIHTFTEPPNMVVPALALLALGVAASIFYGYLVIMVIIISYVIHIPFAVRTKRWVAAHPETWDDTSRQRRAQRRAIRRQQPHRRSVTRLGLRRPQR